MKMHMMRVGFGGGPITSLSGGGELCPTQMTISQGNLDLQRDRRGHSYKLRATSAALWRKDSPSGRERKRKRGE
eukprot:8793494-Ditylum_brightwellii.AAC.1